jgi:hypothetical protein
LYLKIQTSEGMPDGIQRYIIDDENGISDARKLTET